MINNWEKLILSQITLTIAVTQFPYIMWLNY